MRKAVIEFSDVVLSGSIEADPSAVEPADLAGTPGSWWVIRGSSYGDEAWYLRSAYRDRDHSENADRTLGFRVCLPAARE